MSLINPYSDSVVGQESLRLEAQAATLLSLAPLDEALDFASDPDWRSEFNSRVSQFLSSLALSLLQSSASSASRNILNAALKQIAHHIIDRTSLISSADNNNAKSTLIPSATSNSQKRVTRKENRLTKRTTTRPSPSQAVPSGGPSIDTLHFETNLVCLSCLLLVSAHRSNTKFATDVNQSAQCIVRNQSRTSNTELSFAASLQQQAQIQTLTSIFTHHPTTCNLSRLVQWLDPATLSVEDANELLRVLSRSARCLALQRSKIDPTMWQNDSGEGDSLALCRGAEQRLFECCDWLCRHWCEAHQMIDRRHADASLDPNSDQVNNTAAGVTAISTSSRASLDALLVVTLYEWYIELAQSLSMADLALSVAQNLCSLHQILHPFEERVERFFAQKGVELFRAKDFGEASKWFKLGHRLMIDLPDRSQTTTQHQHQQNDSRRRRCVHVLRLLSVCHIELDDCDQALQYVNSALSLEVNATLIFTKVTALLKIDPIPGQVVKGLFSQLVQSQDATCDQACEAFRQCAQAAQQLGKQRLDPRHARDAKDPFKLSQLIEMHAQMKARFTDPKQQEEIEILRFHVLIAQGQNAAALDSLRELCANLASNNQAQQECQLDSAAGQNVAQEVWSQACALFRSNDFVNAKHWMEAYLALPCRLSPSNLARGHRALALIHCELGQSIETQAALDLSLEFEPHNAASRMLSIRLLLLADKVQEAEAQMIKLHNRNQIICSANQNSTQKRIELHDSDRARIRADEDRERHQTESQSVEHEFSALSTCDFDHDSGFDSDFENSQLIGSLCLICEDALNRQCLPFAQQALENLLEYQGLHNQSGLTSQSNALSRQAHLLDSVTIVHNLVRIATQLIDADVEAWRQSIADMRAAQEERRMRRVQTKQKLKEARDNLPQFANRKTDINKKQPNSDVEGDAGESDSDSSGETDLPTSALWLPLPESLLTQLNKVDQYASFALEHLARRGCEEASGCESGHRANSSPSSKLSIEQQFWCAEQIWNAATLAAQKALYSNAAILFERSADLWTGIAIKPAPASAASASASSAPQSATATSRSHLHSCIPTYSACQLRAKDHATKARIVAASVYLEQAIAIKVPRDAQRDQNNAATEQTQSGLSSDAIAVLTAKHQLQLAQNATTCIQLIDDADQHQLNQHQHHQIQRQAAAQKPNSELRHQIVVLHWKIELVTLSAQECITQLETRIGAPEVKSEQIKRQDELAEKVFASLKALQANPSRANNSSAAGLGQGQEQQASNLFPIAQNALEVLTALAKHLDLSHFVSRCLAARLDQVLSQEGDGAKVALEFRRQLTNCCDSSRTILIFHRLLDYANERRLISGSSCVLFGFFPSPEGQWLMSHAWNQGVKAYRKRDYQSSIHLLRAAICLHKEFVLKGEQDETKLSRSVLDHSRKLQATVEWIQALIKQNQRAQDAETSDDRVEAAKESNVKPVPPVLHSDRPDSSARAIESSPASAAAAAASASASALRKSAKQTPRAQDEHRSSLPSRRPTAIPTAAAAAPHASSAPQSAAAADEEAEFQASPDVEFDCDDHQDATQED